MQTSSLQQSPLTTLTPAASSKAGNSVNEAEPAGSSFQDAMARQVNKTAAVEKQPATARAEANNTQKSPAASADKEAQQDSVAPADEAAAPATVNAVDQTDIFLALANGVKDAKEAKDTKDAKPAEADQAIATDASKGGELLGATVAAAVLQPPVPLATPTPTASPLVTPTPTISAVAGRQAVHDTAPTTGTADFTSSPESIAKTDSRDAVDTHKPKAQPANTDAADREAPAARTQQTLAANTQTAALAMPATSAAASKPELALAIHSTEKSMLPDSAAKLASDAIQPGSGVFSLSAHSNISAAPNIVGSANEIKAAPGSQAWDQAVGNKIVWMVGNAEQSASLTLNPPDLGPLQVIIKMQNDQASATFISAHQEVRQALEAAIPTLRTMMNDAGISLGQTTINMGNPQQQNFQDMGNKQAANQTADLTNDSVGGLSASTETAFVRRVSSGLVDTFA
jgi:flagellar hook-length control protein FliK